MTEYGTWSPYVGTGAVFLAVTLLAIGVLLTYLGTRLSSAVGIKRPGKTARRIGFSYPSDPTSFTLNGISKPLSFVTAIMLFLKANKAH